jgi:hypothetical protein
MMDYLASFMAELAFSQFFGLMFMLVGAAFITSSVIGQ